ILAVGAMAQNHVGGGAQRRREDRHRVCGEAVLDAVAVVVSADDLAAVVDVQDLGTDASAAQRIVEGGEDAADIEEAVLPEVAVAIIPDDLTGVVDAERDGVVDAQRVDEGDGSAAAVEEA